MTEPQLGLKRERVPRITNGDIIVRQTPAGGDLAMRVERYDWSIGPKGGTISFTGPTFALNIGKRSEELGEDTWTLPSGGEVTKVVPFAEADHD